MKEPIRDKVNDRNALRAKALSLVSEHKVRIDDR